MKNGLNSVQNIAEQENTEQDIRLRQRILESDTERMSQINEIYKEMRRSSIRARSEPP